MSKLIITARQKADEKFFKKYAKMVATLAHPETADEEAELLSQQYVQEPAADDEYPVKLTHFQSAYLVICLERFMAEKAFKKSRNKYMLRMNYVNSYVDTCRIVNKHRPEFIERDFVEFPVELVDKETPEE